MPLYDHDAAHGGSSTALVRHISDAGDADPVPRVTHHAPFVAQMIASAKDVPHPYRRRRSDRVAPLDAYAALDTPPKGGTRKIV